MVWHLAQPKHPRKGERNSGEKSWDSKSRAASTPCPHLPLIYKSMEEREPTKRERELDKNTTQPQLVCLRACQQRRTALGHRGQELPRAHSAAKGGLTLRMGDTPRHPHCPCAAPGAPRPRKQLGNNWIWAG